MAFPTHAVYTGHCPIKLTPEPKSTTSTALKKRPFSSLSPPPSSSLGTDTLPNPPSNLSPNPSACTQVLNTIELLEQILIRLRWNELFIHQRVSKTWHSVIQRSLHAREKMYLTSQEPPLQPVTDIESYRNNNQSRIIYRRAKLETNPATKFYGACSDEGLHNPLALWVINNITHFVEYSIGVEGTPEGVPDEKLSWRQMLLTKPPLPAISLDVLPHPDVPQYWSRLTLWNKTGVTLGDVHDMTWKLALQHERTFGARHHGRLAAIVIWLMRVDGNGAMDLGGAW